MSVLVECPKCDQSNYVNCDLCNGNELGVIDLAALEWLRKEHRYLWSELNSLRAHYFAVFKDIAASHDRAANDTVKLKKEKDELAAQLQEARKRLQYYQGDAA